LDTKKSSKKKEKGKKRYSGKKMRKKIDRRFQSTMRRLHEPWEEKRKARCWDETFGAGGPKAGRKGGRVRKRTTRVLGRQEQSLRVGKLAALRPKALMGMKQMERKYQTGGRKNCE